MSSAADSSIQPQENAGNPSPEAAEQQQETSDGISTDSGFTTTGETQIIAIKDGVEIVQHIRLAKASLKAIRQRNAGHEKK